jgi:hypothetical protein
VPQGSRGEAACSGFSRRVSAPAFRGRGGCPSGTAGAAKRRFCTMKDCAGDGPQAVSPKCPNSRPRPSEAGVRSASANIVQAVSTAFFSIPDGVDAGRLLIGTFYALVAKEYLAG